MGTRKLGTQNFFIFVDASGLIIAIELFNFKTVEMRLKMCGGLLICVSGFSSDRFTRSILYTIAGSV